MTLIEKLEQATEGSRELDAEIAVALGLVPDGGFLMNGNVDGATFGLDAYKTWVAPYLSTSVDAILKEVPEGWYPGVDPLFFDETGTVKYDAFLFKPIWKMWSPGPHEWIERIEARANTIPIGYCIAVLKVKGYE